MKVWGPRYLAYAKAHGTLDPDAMLARDRERYPGGSMAGFLVWIAQRWAEWCAETKRRRPLTEEDHAAFDAWLSERVETPA